MCTCAVHIRAFTASGSCTQAFILSSAVLHCESFGFDNLLNGLSDVDIAIRICETFLQVLQQEQLAVEAALFYIAHQVWC